MAFLPTQDGCRVVMEWRYGEARYTNHLWFVRYTPWGTQEQLELVQGLKGVAGLSNYFTSIKDGAFLDFKSVDERTVDGPVVYAGGSDIPGTSVAEVLPAGTALVVTLRTAKRGRAHRGRLYMPLLTEAAWDDSGFTSGVQNDLLNLLNDMSNSATSTGWTWGVRSAQLDGVPRNPAVIEPLTGYQIRSPLAGSQRRRSKRP